MALQTHEICLSRANIFFISRRYKIMDDLFIQLMGEALELAKKESLKYAYFIKKETIDKLEVISRAFGNEKFEIEFDALTNSMDIFYSNYVVDSLCFDIKTVFQTVDMFSIDARNDDKVCVEMRIRDAAVKVRNEQP